jgi:nucleoside-diphosphate-sugar epimerase
MTGTVLIVGASGVIGSSAVQHFSGLPGWRVIGLSRRPAQVDADVVYEHLALDLNDASACRAKAADLTDVMHIVYAALFEKPGLIAGWREQDQMDTNLAMMRNLLEPLLSKAKSLRHISVLQGTKAYGAHVHPIDMPAREDRPRDDHANFYWLQEDFIRSAQTGADWSFTIWRPQVVYGGAIGVAMNLIPVIGAYAAICRELGLPFACPGDQPNISEAVDADLIASALAWASQAPAARNETFNITNGDVMIWPHIWPSIARAVGLEPVFGQPVVLSQFLARHAATWDAIVAKHGLTAPPITELVGESDHYADMLIRSGPVDRANAVLVSTIKLRQAGFGDCIDTEVMFAKWLDRLVQRKILPPSV